MANAYAAGSRTSRSGDRSTRARAAMAVTPKHSPAAAPRLGLRIGSGSRAAAKPMHASTTAATGRLGRSGSGTVARASCWQLPLTCTVPVTPGQQVTVQIAVADTSDHVYDSAVAALDGGIWTD